MIAFQKFCQKKLTTLIVPAAIIGLIILIGIIGGSVAIYFKGIPALYAKKPALFELMLNGFAGLFFLMLATRVISFYTKGDFFSKQCLLCVKTIGSLALLFSFVIQPAFHSIIIYFSGDETAIKQLGVLTYIANVNIILAIVGYILHLTSAVNKVARDMEAEQKLTV